MQAQWYSRLILALCWLVTSGGIWRPYVLPRLQPMQLHAKWLISCTIFLDLFFFFFLRLYGLFWGTPGCTVGDHETRVSIMQGSTKSMFLSSGLQNSLVRNWRRKMCFYVNNETEFICAEIGKALHSPDRQILKRSLDLLPLANSKPTCYHLNHWICHFAKTRIQYIRTWILS